MYARHISEHYELFDSWLTDCLKRSMELFPNEQWQHDDLDDLLESYDSNQDDFIPREFYFTQGFDYKTADLTSIICQMLSSANYKENDFLNSPNDMIDDGFKGTPYQLQIEE